MLERWTRNIILYDVHEILHGTAKLQKFRIKSLGESLETAERLPFRKPPVHRENNNLDLRMSEI